MKWNSQWSRLNINHCKHLWFDIFFCCPMNIVNTIEIVVHMCVRVCVCEHEWVSTKACVNGTLFVLLFFHLLPLFLFHHSKIQIHSPRTKLCLRLFIMKIIGINAQFHVNVIVCERLCSWVCIWRENEIRVLKHYPRPTYRHSNQKIVGTEKK